MNFKFALAGLAAAAVLGASAPAMASTSHPCFFITQWHSWKAPNADTIYLGVNAHDIYRLDLSAGSSDLTAPGMHLVSEFRGTSSVCTALDLDLKVSDGHGFVTPLIVRSITKLTPEEVAAIPPRDRP